MPHFIDTSALFKRYQPEKGTALVSQILQESDEPVFISSITIIEIVSNLKRLCDVDKITTEEQFLKAADFFLPGYRHFAHYDSRCISRRPDSEKIHETG